MVNMKIRDSGMPEEQYWESFFDPGFIFSQLYLNSNISDAAEFGSGYGTFTIPAAKIIKGKVYAFDIDPLVTERLKQRIALQKMNNINVLIRDFVNEGTGLQNNSVDYVMLFNILHAEDPLSLLKEAYRILRKGGYAGIIHWIYSESTPRGPSLNIRPKPEECISWVKESGFQNTSEVISLPPYHYGIIGKKSTAYPQPLPKEGEL